MYSRRRNGNKLLWLSLLRKCSNYILSNGLPTVLLTICFAPLIAVWILLLAPDLDSLSTTESLDTRGSSSRIRMTPIRQDVWHPVGASSIAITGETEPAESAPEESLHDLPANDLESSESFSLVRYEDLSIPRPLGIKKRARRTLLAIWKNPQWFLAIDGTVSDALQAKIQERLGADASVEPGCYDNNVGHWIRFHGQLTAQKADSITFLLRQWCDEYQDPVPQVVGQSSYYDHARGY